MGGRADRGGRSGAHGGGVEVQLHRVHARLESKQVGGQGGGRGTGNAASILIEDAFHHDDVTMMTSP